MTIRVFDMHCDTIGPLGMADCEPYLSRLKDDNLTGDLACTNCELSGDRMRVMGWAQCYAIWTPDDCPSASHHDFYRRGADWFKHQMALHSDMFVQVCDMRDVRTVIDSGKIAAVFTVENAAMVEDGLDVVDEFVEDGVKIAGITWNGKNVLGSGTDSTEGLTALGCDYVRLLEDRGIVVDVSHLNDAGFWDVEHVARKPFIATHSNARAVCKAPRNLTDDQFRAIAERGGLAGLNFYENFVRDGGGAYDFDELAAHVEHWLSLGGEDAIALGADRDGSTVPTWIADCSSQQYLHDRMVQRFGEP